MEQEICLSFCPQQAFITIRLSSDGAKIRTITLTVKLADSCRVLNGDYYTLRYSDWTIELINNQSHSLSEGVEFIGLLSRSSDSKYDVFHFPERSNVPKKCFVKIVIDSLSFQTAYDTLKTGKLPSLIYVSVNSLKHSCDLDLDSETRKKGDGIDDKTIIWENTDTRPHVKGFSITSTLVDDEAEAPEVDFEEPIILATSADANAIRQEVTGAIMQMQNEVLAQNRWLVGIGVVIVILLTMHFI
jgi:hypothetical protein